MSKKHLQKVGGGFSMILSSDLSDDQSHDYRIRFTPALNLTGADRWMVALENLQSWYTWFNVSSDYDNTTFRYYNGAAYKTVNLTPGIYNASDLINAIEVGITANSDDPLNLVWSVNENTQKFVLTLLNGYKVDFGGYNIATLFGGNQAEYSTSGAMPNVAQMTNNVNTWLVHCDLLDFGICGPFQGKVLHSFSPDVSPGEAIQLQPNLTYSLVRPASHVQDVRIWITDQTGRALSIQNQPMTLKLHLKPLAFI